MDAFPSMTALLGALPAAGNYSIHADRSHHSSVKLFAPHGGCIEPGTEPIAFAIAGDTLDTFSFSGMRKKDCFKTLHVTSIHYDEPHCLQMASEAEVAVAIHGCEGEHVALLIGGGNQSLTSSLILHLAGLGYPAVRAEGGLSGEGANNFINRAKRGGVQLELSAGFRRRVFPSFPKSSHRDAVEFPKFVAAMRAWIAALDPPAA